MTRRKKILSFLLAAWMLGNFSYQNQTSLNYEIIDNEECFAHYSRGRVFIGKQDVLDSLLDISENDILILDGRGNEDPNIRVLSSHQIEDPVIRAEILEIIKEYEINHPSSWDRTIEAMNVEWIVHNLLYSMNYKQKRTSEVDFNNKDEKIYRKEFLRYIIHD